MGKNAPINGQLGIQDASSNCPCFCFSAFSPWTLKAGSQGKALFWGEEKRGRGREIRVWLRRGEGESFFFFAIPANCETLASGKAVCLTRLIDFYGSKPRWKSVISYDVLPFLLITIDSYMIDLYHYVHDVICIICMIALFYPIDLVMNIIIYICLIVTRVYTINLIISLARLDLFHLANRSKFILLNRGSVFHASKVVLLFLLGNKRRRNSFQRYPRFH